MPNTQSLKCRQCGLWRDSTCDGATVLGLYGICPRRSWPHSVTGADNGCELAVKPKE